MRVLAKPNHKGSFLAYKYYNLLWLYFMHFLGYIKVIKIDFVVKLYYSYISERMKKYVIF